MRADVTVHTCDLSAVARSAAGTAWSRETEQLDATLLAWPAGHVVEEHVNTEREVLLVGVAGQAAVEVDGEVHELRPATIVLIPRGARRRIECGAAGSSYLSVHVARGPLQLRPRARQ
ncbi:MAG: Cupin 2, conserved barrel [Thermoleophilia bacterium]|nr:Cupin 2, conserved barrel [Thermoleophilia bacterium]